MLLHSPMSLGDLVRRVSPVPRPLQPGKHPRHQLVSQQVVAVSVSAYQTKITALCSLISSFTGWGGCSGMIYYIAYMVLSHRGWQRVALPGPLCTALREFLAFLVIQSGVFAPGKALSQEVGMGQCSLLGFLGLKKYSSFAFQGLTSTAGG